MMLENAGTGVFLFLRPLRHLFDAGRPIGNVVRMKTPGSREAWPRGFDFALKS
jgi:hypothetical protein